MVDFILTLSKRKVFAILTEFHSWLNVYGQIYFGNLTIFPRNIFTMFSQYFGAVWEIFAQSANWLSRYPGYEL